MIAFSKITVPRFNDKIVTGQSVRILAEIASTGVSSQLIDPESLPAISLFYPSGANIIANRQMVRFAKGLFSYTYDVPVLFPLGIYTGSFSVKHQSSYARLEKVSLFKVMRLSDVELVSYLAWKDQDGVVWYSYINTLRELVTIDHVPDLFNKEALQLFNPVPYWLEILDISNNTVYIHPSTIGEIITTVVQPTIGFGTDDSYTWYGEDGFSYVLGVNIVHELVITKVN